MKSVTAGRGPRLEPQRGLQLVGTARRAARTLALFAVIALAGAGCSDVKDSLDGADKGMSGVLNGPDAAAFEGLTGTALTDALYDSGLRLQAEGKDAEAFQRFQQAAGRGHGPAAYELGEAYNAGRGVEQDLNAGAKWINDAALRGEPRAQYAVGAALYNGAGVSQDYARATAYLGRAAEQGHADAQFLLGECYANGRGVTKNLSWAARWYGKAAAQGHPDGAFSFGVVQAAGLGLPINMPDGYAWLDIASDRGHRQAGDVRSAIANKMSPAEIEAGKRRSKAFAPESDVAFADKPTVMYVQYSLNQLGFNAGVVDGLMGPRTRSAISAYLSSIGDGGSGNDVTPALLQHLFEGQQNAT